MTCFYNRRSVFTAR